MKKLSNSKLVIQVVIASLVATLAMAGIVAASTTIGSNISTGGTLSVDGASTLTGNTAVTGTLGVTGNTTLVNASSTLLTVSGQSWLNGNATVATGRGLILTPGTAPSSASEGMIYYDSTSDVMKMYDGSAWYTVGTSTSGLTLANNSIRLSDTSYYETIGTTTQQGLTQLTVEATSTAAIPLTLVARSSQAANLFQIRNSGSANLLFVNSNGGLYASSTIQATATTTLYSDLRVDTNTLLVDAFNNLICIGTTTPLATLSVNDVAGVNPFVIGSSTATYLTVDTTGNLAVDTNTLLVDAVNNKVGIGSTTPSSALSMGTNMTSTSTVMVGRLCLIAAQENGTVVYLRLGANQAANQPFATSTIPCNQ